MTHSTVPPDQMNRATVHHPRSAYREEIDLILRARCIRLSGDAGQNRKERPWCCCRTSNCRRNTSGVSAFRMSLPVGGDEIGFRLVRHRSPVDLIGASVFCGEVRRKLGVEAFCLCENERLPVGESALQ
jgi:hypothetical protein